MQSLPYYHLILLHLSLFNGNTTHYYEVTTFGGVHTFALADLANSGKSAVKMIQRMHEAYQWRRSWRRLRIILPHVQM